jgi:hypothetical protein
MKPGTLVAAILGAGVIAGITAGLLIGGQPSWLRAGRSEREEREAYEATLKARFGTFILAGSATSMRSEWPHTVTYLSPLVRRAWPYATSHAMAR